MTESTADSLLIPIAPLLESTGTSRCLQGEVILEPIHVGDVTFTFTRPVQYEVTLLGAVESVVITGTVSGNAITECSRCLKPFELGLTGEVDAYLVREDESSADEDDVEVMSGDTIDLQVYLVAALALGTSFAPVHSEDCAGICPVCGSDLNNGVCECDPSELESPFSAIQDFFDEEG